MSDVDAHLLIVDDDERIRMLLQKFLMRAGFLVSGARDAAHARRLLAGLDFDLIVMDVMMPGRNRYRPDAVCAGDISGSDFASDSARRDGRPYCRA